MSSNSRVVEYRGYKRVAVRFRLSRESLRMGENFT